jgi:uncharacterized membrane protein
MLNKYEYVKDIPDEIISFETIFSKCLEKHYMKIVDQNVVHEIKNDLSLLYHTFYPFIPINDIQYRIDVHIYDQKINIYLNDYSKYHGDLWSKTTLKKELRVKKLTRILNEKNIIYGRRF